MTEPAVTDEYRGKWGCAGIVVILGLIVWSDALSLLWRVLVVLMAISVAGAVIGKLFDWVSRSGPSVLDEQWRAGDEQEWNEDASGEWE